MASGGRQNMQNSVVGNIQFINETDSIIHGKGDYGGMKRSREDAGLEHTDSDNEGSSSGFGFAQSEFVGSKSGKKTRGRVKIDMKYIDNKLRRYTTFSKRKTGIMKKAYELSTLTGTQVMLLVASETGHVYTFATRKLQPMITSDTGKALIQTCLNSPDMGQSSPGQIQPADQRMNPSGYEETEISYGQEDDLSPRVTPPERLPPEGNIKQESLYGAKSNAATPMYVINQPQQQTQPVNGGGDNPTIMITPDTNSTNVHESLSNHQQIQSSQQQGSNNALQGNKQSSSVTMQLPAASYVLPNSVAPFALQTNNPVHRPNSPVSQQTTVQPQVILQQPGSNTSNQNTDTGTAPALVSSSSALSSQQGITFLQGGMNSANTSQATLVYQTLQGMLCASPQQLPEGFVVGVPQGSSVALPQSDGGTGGTPQYITIPVPVSVAANAAHPQMFAIPVSQSSGTSVDTNKT